MTEKFSSDHKLYVDWGKLASIIAVILATVALAMTGRVSEGSTMLILGMAAGYVFGNGRQAVRGIPPQPIIGARPTETDETEG